MNFIEFIFRSMFMMMVAARCSRESNEGGKCGSLESTHRLELFGRNTYFNLFEVFPFVIFCVGKSYGWEETRG